MQKINSNFEVRVVKISSLWDHHGHLSMLGAKFDKLNLKKIDSLDELYELLRKTTLKKEKGEWIIGSQLNPSLWGEKFLNLKKLDNVSPQNPIFLERIDAHSAIINSLAMSLAGINPQIKIKGGFFERKKGILTGGITDSLVEIVLKSIGELSEKSLEKYFKRAFFELKKNFLSGATDMMITKKESEVLQKMDRQGKLELPILGYLKWSKNQNIPNFLYKGRKYFEDGIKVFIDGALGSRGAYLNEPYCDDSGNYGIKNFDEKEICEILTECNKKNVNISFHIIGDEALETFLNSFEKMGKLNIEVRLEHLQVTPKELIERLRKIDVVISLQPCHYLSDRKWAQKRLGVLRYNHSYLLKSLIKDRKKFLFGTDFPIESLNPARTITGCMERKKEEQISIKTILKGMKAPKSFKQFERSCIISLISKKEDFFRIKKIKIDYLNGTN